MNEGPIEIPLREKYLVDAPAKFGGKKRSPGNSGGRGKAGRRSKRTSSISQHNSPEQYGQWKRAFGGKQ